MLEIFQADFTCNNLKRPVLQPPLPHPVKKASTLVSSWIAQDRSAPQTLKSARVSFKDLVDTFQISPQGTHAGIIAYSSDSELIVNFADDNSQTPSAMKDIIDKYLNLILIFIPVHFYTTSSQQSKLTIIFCFIRRIHFSPVI